jgi:site-specific recombinase
VTHLGISLLSARDLVHQIQLKFTAERTFLHPHLSLSTATHAYRQLAVVLRNQGLNEGGVRFVYRTQLMKSKVSRYQQKFGRCFDSLFLDLLAGYGNKPWYRFVAHLFVS